MPPKACSQLPKFALRIQNITFQSIQPLTSEVNNNQTISYIRLHMVLENTTNVVPQLPHSFIFLNIIQNVIYKYILS